MKNPTWQRDELILALDLYLQLEPGQIHGRNPQVEELSELLNRLPIHDQKLRDVKFRNPNGVGLKLSNFLAIDPAYSGKGMQRFGRLDQKVFLEFANDLPRLRQIASSIRKAVGNEEVREKLYAIQDEEDLKPLWEVKEGKVLYKLHKLRERDQLIIQEKKELVFQEMGRLLCEACEFDFERTYGRLGQKFIECHHTTPLASSSGERITRLQDLALVCANCHRMLHRDLSRLTVPGLQAVVRERRRGA
jgi:5-methylcytosine-specific restriction enzyme A